MDILIVGLGLLLRLGLPLAVTALLAWWLKRLDARWQAAAARPAPARGRPCWELRNCAPERRRECQAYAQPDQPCWQVWRAAEGELRPACLTCFVFQDAPVPA